MFVLCVVYCGCNCSRLTRKPGSPEACSSRRRPLRPDNGPRLMRMAGGRLKASWLPGSIARVLREPRGSPAEPRGSQAGGQREPPRDPPAGASGSHAVASLEPCESLAGAEREASGSPAGAHKPTLRYVWPEHFLWYMYTIDYHA